MAYTWKIVFLLAICSEFWSGTTSQAVYQVFSGFDNLNCVYTEPFGLLGRYMLDLKNYNDNDDVAVAVSGLGNWIFYDEHGYTGESEAVVLRVYSQCVPLKTLVSRASSIRYVGDPQDYRLPSITIYQGSNFQGREIYINADHPKVLFDVDRPNGGWSEEFGSFIITGDSSSCWTLHYSIGQGSPSICVCAQSSNNFTPFFVANNPFPPYNSIGSVTKGCSNKPSAKRHVIPGFDSQGIAVSRD